MTTHAVAALPSEQEKMAKPAMTRRARCHTGGRFDPAPLSGLHVLSVALPTAAAGALALDAVMSSTFVSTFSSHHQVVVGVVLALLTLWLLPPTRGWNRSHRQSPESRCSQPERRRAVAPPASPIWWISGPVFVSPAARHVRGPRLW